MPNTETHKMDSVERIVSILDKHLLLDKEHIINTIKDLNANITQIHKDQQVMKAKLEKLEKQHLIGSEHMNKSKVDYGVE